MQPTANRLDAPHPTGLAGQRQENGLGHVLGRMMIAQDPQTDAVDQRGMTFDQRGKGRLAAGLGEHSKEFAVGLVGFGHHASVPAFHSTCPGSRGRFLKKRTAAPRPAGAAVRANH
jgi:hypothetical protein